MTLMETYNPSMGPLHGKMDEDLIVNGNEPNYYQAHLDGYIYYRVKENGWTWAYSDRWQIEANFPTTEDPDLSNPIVITNTPKDDTPKHAEAVKRNELKNY